MLTDMLSNDVLAEIFIRVDKLHFVIPRVCANWRDIYAKLHNIQQNYEGCDFFSQIDHAVAGTLLPATPDICAECVDENNVELLKWAGDDGHRSSSITKVSRVAIMRGELSMLKWAVSHGQRLCDWLGELAANHGHLHILKWLYKKGANLTQYAFTIAFERGNVGIMDYIFKNSNYENLIPDFDSPLYRFATNETLIWLHTHNCIPDYTPADLLNTCLHGNLREAAKWIIETYPDIVRRCKINWSYVHNKETIVWLVDFKLTTMTSGDLVRLITDIYSYTTFSLVLSYVIEHTPEALTADVMDAACKYNLLLVEHLHAAGCPWSTDSLKIACTYVAKPFASRTHLLAIAYMVKNGAGTTSDALEWLRS